MKVLSRAYLVGTLSGRALIGASFLLAASCKDDAGSADGEQRATKDGGAGDSDDDDASTGGDQATTRDDESTRQDDESTTPDTEATTSDTAATTDGQNPATDSDTNSAPDSTEVDTGGEQPPSGIVTPIVSDAACDLITKSVSSTYCELQEICGDTAVYSVCNEATADSWTCSCGGGAGGSATYALSGVTGETACGVTQDLCKQGVSPEFDSEPDCSTTYRSATTTSCQFQQTCSQSASVAEGVTALSSASYTSYCSDLGDGSLSCTCTGPRGSRYFDVSDLTGETACEAGMELCLPGAADIGPVSSECTTTTETASPESCSIQLACTNTVQVGEGSAQTSDAPYSTCTLNANDELVCSCASSGRTLTFELQSGADGTAACEQSLDVCEVTEALERSGNVECDVTAQTVSTTTCQSTVQCKQSSTVNDVKIGVYGTVSTYCSNIEGEWSCDCGSGTASAAFKYQPVEGTDPWDACAEASLVCRQQVGVQIGNGSGFLFED